MPRSPPLGRSSAVAPKARALLPSVAIPATATPQYDRPTDSRSLAESLRQRSKATASDRFFHVHANLVSNLRETQDLVFVDFGGLPKAKDIVLLHRCTHFIIISRDPAVIAHWQEFCHHRGGLQPLAIIHSKLEPCLRILKTDPYLELEAGPWDDSTQTVPPEILQPVLALLSSTH